MTRRVASVSILAFVGLAACEHVAPLSRAGRQAIRIDQQTALLVKVDGADVRQAAPENAGQLMRRGGEPIHRILESGDGKVLFAYDLEIGKVDPAGSYRFLLKPTAGKPTFAASREVTVKAQDDAVRVELMEQPDTGRKIVDVFQLVKLEGNGSEEHSSDGFLDHLKRVHDRFFHAIHGGG